ncbi:Mur ligase family protein [bacterium]|nr:Mur ligase family protein [bacterium]
MKNYLNYLFSLESKGIKLGLERTEKLFHFCKNPQKNFPSIQVIGTNGKGSTSAMIANILKTANYKVGLYTSPHLTKINERIRINGIAIQDDDIIEFITQYKDCINTLNVSFFEVITAIAVWYFNKNNIDIAILETGLGGRLDSVTACDSNTLVCTSISKDHQHILGDTIEKIAYEKICALKSNMTCISTNHHQSIKNIFDDYAASIGVQINYVNENHKKKYIQLNGQHQLENESLAIQTIKSLNNFNITKTQIKDGLSSVLWPARIQKIDAHPNIYFDVAHNSASFLSLCDFANSLDGPKILILALQKNKNINDIINNIEDIFDKIIITQTNVRNYYPSEELSALFTKINKKIISNPQKALQSYQSFSLNTNIIIAGSHYLGPLISREFKISFDNI